MEAKDIKMTITTLTSDLYAVAHGGAATPFVTTEDGLAYLRKVKQPEPCAYLFRLGTGRVSDPYAYEVRVRQDRQTSAMYLAADGTRHPEVVPAVNALRQAYAEASNKRQDAYTEAKTKAEAEYGYRYDANGKEVHLMTVRGALKKAGLKEQSANHYRADSGFRLRTTNFHSNGAGSWKGVEVTNMQVTGRYAPATDEENLAAAKRAEANHTKALAALRERGLHAYGTYKAGTRSSTIYVSGWVAGE